MPDAARTITPWFADAPDTQALTMPVTSNLTRAFDPVAVTHTPWRDVSKSPPGVSQPSAQAAAPLLHSDVTGNASSTSSPTVSDEVTEARNSTIASSTVAPASSSGSSNLKTVFLSGAHSGVLDDGDVCRRGFAQTNLILSVSHMPRGRKYRMSH